MAREIRVAAVVPAYNEEQTIGAVVQVLKRAPHIDEVIVVSDGSTDQTAQHARMAGADSVLELSSREGKGAALEEGVRHSAAEVVFFVDADLVDLTPEHVAIIVEPVLRGERVMNVGLLGRPAWTTIAWFMPLIGGQRALLRSVIDSIPSEYLRGFKIESALNYYCRVNGLPYGKVVIPGITIRRKIDKFGLWIGLREYIRMFWQVAKAMVEVRLSRTIFLSKGKHEKHRVA